MRTHSAIAHAGHLLSFMVDPCPVISSQCTVRAVWGADPDRLVRYQPVVGGLLQQHGSTLLMAMGVNEVDGWVSEIAGKIARGEIMLIGELRTRAERAEVLAEGGADGVA